MTRSTSEPILLARCVAAAAALLFVNALPLGAQPAPAKAPSPSQTWTVPEPWDPDTVPARVQLPPVPGADATVFPDGWPTGPRPLPGSLLPRHRIVAYYGNPNSRRMGILGEIAPDRMLERLDEEVARWNAADPAHPVVPALHLVTVVAQAEAGADGDYAARMSDDAIEKVIGWAERRDAIVFLDVQVGTGTLADHLPGLVPYLRLPNVHLGIDPEFMMKGGHRPGTRIGSTDAADVNYAVRLLAELVREHDLPPKVLVLHRFTQNMITNHDDIVLDPRVQVVVHMDGWGRPWLKRRSYRDFIVREPVQYTGIKVFYKNDRRDGSRLMTPEEILELRPAPLYIQYQ